MGLVQRELEQAGMTTVTLSTIAAFTASVGAPRVAAIEYPQGRPFGQPGDASGQHEVLRAALAVAHDSERPGQISNLPFEWPEPPSSVRWHPAEPPPITRLLKRKPWLIPKLLSGDIPD